MEEQVANNPQTGVNDPTFKKIDEILKNYNSTLDRCIREREENTKTNEGTDHKMTELIKIYDKVFKLLLKM